MRRDLLPSVFRPTSLSTLFDDLFTGFEGDSFTSQKFSVDVVKKDDGIELKAELPGVEKDNISVEFEDGVLLIKAERKDESEEKTDKFLRREMSYGSMQRSFNIGPIDPESIKASYKDGILSISLKREEEILKKISVD